MPRNFKLIEVNGKPINYSSTAKSNTPKAAASKCFSTWCKDNKLKGKCAAEITVQEITQGSKKKPYSYNALRRTNSNTVIINGKPITYKYINVLYSIKNRKRTSRTKSQAKARNEYADDEDSMTEDSMSEDSMDDGSVVNRQIGGELYACDSSNWSCAESGTGNFHSQTACEKACVAPPNPKADPEDGLHLFELLSSMLSTRWTECKSYPKPPYSNPSPEKYRKGRLWNKKWDIAALRADISECIKKDGRLDPEGLIAKDRENDLLEKRLVDEHPDVDIKKPPLTNGEKNFQFLKNVGQEVEDQIVSEMAKHYKSPKYEIYDEIYSDRAKSLLSYGPWAVMGAGGEEVSPAALPA